MKKITLTLAVIAAAFTMNAQTSCADAAAVTVGADASTTINVAPLTGVALGADACVTTQSTTAQYGAWYSYTATQDLIVTVTSASVTATTDYYPVLQVLSGNCGALQCETSDWFASNGDQTNPNTFAEVTFFAEAGETFYIHFDDLYSQLGSGANTSFDFTVTTSSNLPAAPSVVANPTPTDGATDVEISTADNNTDGAPDMSVAFSWDVPTTGASDVTRYYLYLGPAGATSLDDLTSLQEGAYVTSAGVNITGMNYDTEYTWAVRPVNIAGDGPDESDVAIWSFTTEEEMSVADAKQDVFTHYISNGQLNLEANSSLESVELFSILGQQVASQKLYDNKESINISHLQAGIYLAQVQVEGKTQTFKFVKK